MPDSPLGRNVRPLRRVGFGVWKSRDGRWTFLRHQSDPHPQRWYVYEDEDEHPANDGTGITTLRDAVGWVGANDGELTPRGRSET